ncbi:signal peptidase I [Flavobacterium azooxidireducens]|uniref:Signal peptidase I n=1 Tax=Flavobacterium azooxidireducens TaxID=1871076 RepID=A0ABY4KBI3_9FLAO|nr:signal peptidase I [Flavobacterium azooxidireducens]UPQ78147.1 signal peptidase I [Flavobacterium azooxidireducens]
MTLYQWFIFFLVIQIVHYLGTWKLYQKAGRKSWEAAVPVYNAIILMKIINRPWWWAFLLFIPIVNLIMFPVVWVETLRSFGKNSQLDTILGVATLGLYIYYVNYTQDVTHIKDRSLHPKNATADFVSSILFAIVVATTVHTYVMQPFVIPTSSLEKSLLVGDFLFVSKFHYGARTPTTAVGLPMVHDSIPIVRTKSYLSWPQLPSFRFPGIESIKTNDIVVFNWPIDTVYKFRDRSGRRVDKPLDKKSNYVKRCLGIPGDSLQIKNGDVYVNGKMLPMHDRQKVQYSYDVITDGTQFNPDYVYNDLQITDGVSVNSQNSYTFFAVTDENAARLRNNPIVKSVTKRIDTDGTTSVFPHTKNWNTDNYGPIYIPQAGKTVALNKETLPFYKMIITDYEKNDLQVNGDEIRINGKVVKDYTFKMDYYWMMGDNRHNSEDSRYWGYVPADHIVGKPVFIWMSLDQNVPWSKAIDKIRWNRLFTTVGGSGEPVSYFIYFVILLAGWFGFDFYRKRKKKKADL